MTITAQEYAQRRKKILEKIGKNAVAIFPSSSEIYRSGDTLYPHRQNSDLYYLTGYSEPESIAVLIPGHDKGEFILFNRERDPLMETWNGKRAGQEGACRDFGADKALPIKDFVAQLPTLLANRQTVYYAFGRHPEIDQIMTNTVNHIRDKVRAGVTAPSTITNSETLIHEMRLIKSPAEIELMRKVGQISVTGHKRAMQICKPGIFEYELEAELIHEFFRKGCRSVAYQPIVGSGANTCILHYHENNAQVQDGDLVLIDAGGEFDNYNADITRTFPANGKFTPEQKAIYDIVLAAQLAGIEQVRPGNPWPQVQQTMVRIITEGLVKLGLLSGNVEQLIESKAYQTFYMHNSGHWLGLDTHDVGTYKINNEWRTLSPGMVLTVEPGIYIAANTLGVDKKWWNIGIRIEDDVAVTENGYDILTAGLAKTTQEIEALMAS